MPGCGTLCGGKKVKFLKMDDPEVLEKLEAGFQKLQNSEDCNSLLKRYLTPEIFDKLKTRKTLLGASFLDVIQSGLENLDSEIGVYAPDADSYSVFTDLFDPIIEDYHGGFKSSNKHPSKDFGSLDSFGHLEPDPEEDKFVVSTRLSCVRCLEAYPFNPCLTEAMYREIEERISTALASLTGEIAGTYQSLAAMDKEAQKQLIDENFLFKEGDKFLQAANGCRYWPTGRGIFINDNKTFVVCVNDGDHLRIISTEQGGDLASVYKRMVAGVSALEKKLSFSRSDRLGYLTSCPVNLGTAIEASVFIRLSNSALDEPYLIEIIEKLNIKIRGTKGKHTAVAEGKIYEISNKRGLGLTEFRVVKELEQGMIGLIKHENEFEIDPEKVVNDYIYGSF